MKILYHHRTRSKDGQNVHIEELTAALRQRGHELIVVAPAAMENEGFGAEAGIVAVLKKVVPKPLYEIAELAYSVVAYRRLRAAYLAHRPDVLYERYNLFLPAGVWLKRRFGIPMLSEVNAPVAEERERFDGLSLIRLARWSQNLVWREADYVLPVTEVLADYVRRAGVPDDRIVVIHNGINREMFPAVVDREAAKIALGLGGRTLLGFTGFIRTWHGLERVVDLVAASDPALNLHFLVVGDGPARADIEARARKLGAEDRITFAGIVDRDRIRDYVSAFDIALQPDVVPYASPLKIFEYMAMGCAIVAPDSPNIREILTDGETAVLFDHGKPDAFSAAVARVCADGDLRARIGANANRHLDEDGFTWANNARRVEALMDELLAANPVLPQTAPDAVAATKTD